MAIEQRILGYRNDACDQLHLLFTVPTSSLINTTFTVNHTFSRAWLSGTTPKIMGSNARKAGGGAVAVIANATSMSVYLRGLSPTAYTDENVIVDVTLEGLL